MNKINAVKELIKRVIPDHADSFILEYVEDDNGKDVYEIDYNSGKIVLRGNNNNSIASALGQYLKHTANVNFSWCGSDVTLPKELPAPTYNRRVIDQKYRVYLNRCTFSYSAAWWDFDRWEKEIDFMAMNGINMPFCAVGIEGIWYYTLTEFGFTDEEARSFIAGPAFLSWQYVGNLESFGGSVSRSWIDKRIELGKRIIDRVVSCPDSNIVLKRPWFGMDPTAQLDPTDALFKTLGTKFMETQRRLFGLYGFYSADPFSESKAPVEGDDYLRRVGESVCSLYEELDTNYVWVMTTWTPKKEIIEAVPKDKLILLDLNGVKYKELEQFWDCQFIIGTLHNFGGRIKLHGDIQRLADNPYITAKDKGVNVIGTGLFMEGINQNPAFYDLAFDMLTRSDKVVLEPWIKKYVYRRYKTNDDNAIKAWNIIVQNVYVNEPQNWFESSSIICARPAVNVKKSGPNLGFRFVYENSELEQAIKLLLDVDSCTDGFEFDLMDITRQYLSNYAYPLYQKVSQSFLNKDKDEFSKNSAKFLTLLSDVDKLLQHRDDYSFERWITDAGNCATEEDEKALFEYNASALVTIWGKDELSNIFDYSWREWSGLIEQFYKMRWGFFFEKLSKFLDEAIEYSEEGLPLVHGREAWRANELYSEMADKEVEWIRSEKHFERREPGDLRAYVRLLMEKYPTVSA